MLRGWVFSLLAVSILTLGACKERKRYEPVPPRDPGHSRPGNPGNDDGNGDSDMARCEFTAKNGYLLTFNGPTIGFFEDFELDRENKEAVFKNGIIPVARVLESWDAIEDFHADVTVTSFKNMVVQDALADLIRAKVVDYSKSVRQDITRPDCFLIDDLTITFQVATDPSSDRVTPLRPMKQKVYVDDVKSLKKIPVQDWPQFLKLLK